MSAAIYARFSSDVQHERSLVDQERLCREFAGREGMTPTLVFTDAAQSGSTMRGRDGLRALLAAVATGAVQTVLVESIDRLARNQRDIADIYQRFEFAGARILSVQEGWIDELHIGLKGTMDALFLKGHRIKVKRGHMGAIRQGRAACALVYGYRLVPGQPGVWEIDPVKADVIRRVYDAYIAGDSVRTIAKRLNDEGVPTARGGQWGTSHIAGNMARRSGILANPIYKGERIYGRQSFPRDPVTGKKTARINPESEWTRVEVPHLAIVTDEQWDAVQAIKARHTSNRHRGALSKRYALSGVLSCGACGSALTVRRKVKAGGVFACTRHVNTGTCSETGFISEGQAMPRILDGMRSHLLDPDFLQIFVDEYQAEWERLWRGPRGDVDLIRADEKRARAAVDNLLAMIEAGADGVALLSRLSQREAELARLSDQVQRMDRAKQNARAGMLPATNLAARFREQLDNLDLLLAEDTARANTALRELVSARITYPENKKDPKIDVTISGSSICLGAETAKSGGSESSLRALIAEMRFRFAA